VQQVNSVLDYKEDIDSTISFVVTMALASFGTLTRRAVTSFSYVIVVSTVTA